MIRPHSFCHLTIPTEVGYGGVLGWAEAAGDHVAAGGTEGAGDDGRLLECNEHSGRATRAVGRGGEGEDVRGHLGQLLVELGLVGRGGVDRWRAGAAVDAV